VCTVSVIERQSKVAAGIEKFELKIITNFRRMGCDDVSRVKFLQEKKSVAFSPQANYTDQATAACRRS
jgi:hypothetical protein